MNKVRSSVNETPSVATTRRRITEENPCTFRPKINKPYSPPKWVLQQRAMKNEQEQLKASSLSTTTKKVQASKKASIASKVQVTLPQLKTIKPATRTKSPSTIASKSKKQSALSTLEQAKPTIKSNKPAKETTNMSRRFAQETIAILEAFHANAMAREDDDVELAEAIATCVQDVAQKLESLNQIPMMLLVGASQITPVQPATIEMDAVKPSISKHEKTALNTSEPKQPNNNNVNADAFDITPLKPDMAAVKVKKLGRPSLSLAAIDEILSDITGCITQSVKPIDANITSTTFERRKSRRSQSFYSTTSSNDSLEREFASASPSRLSLSTASTTEPSFEPNKTTAMDMVSFDKWCSDIESGDF